jgi:sterol desaturase/sphingolipid hydroxylase (fatty acid hydroxylase superfamily)
MERLVMSGRSHRAHHLVDGGAHNLGAVLSVWDRAFGTRATRGARFPERFGVGRPEPLGALRNQLDGWSALLATRPSGSADGAPTRGDG